MIFLFGSLLFGTATYVGMLIGNAFADRIDAFPDGPVAHKVPMPALVLGGSVIGYFVGTQVVQPYEIWILAIVCMALAAIWVTDARRGIVPDVFTLGPLFLILIVALWQHQWDPFLSAGVALAPFAIAALLSGGRGMGWGDVKLVALGGAVLGTHVAVLTFAFACLAAVVIHYLRGRRENVIAFAPYLASAIAVAIPLGGWR